MIHLHVLRIMCTMSLSINKRLLVMRCFINTYPILQMVLYPRKKVPVVNVKNIAFKLFKSLVAISTWNELKDISL